MGVRKRWLALVSLGASLVCTGAGAQRVFEEGERHGTMEMGIGYTRVAGERIGGVARSSLDADDGGGIGAAIRYNFTNHFALGLEFAGVEQDYRAVLDTGNSRRMVDSELDMTSTHLTATWYFLPGALTPYVSGGGGWTYIDSNIPSQPPQTGCWWDFWWGYVCSDFYRTYDDTVGSLGASAGVRWDFSPNFFLRAGLGKWWIDLDNSSTASPEVFRLEIGVRQ